VLVTTAVATIMAAMTTVVVVAMPVVVVPVVIAAVVGPTPAAFPTIDIEELTPGKAPVAPERRVCVPPAERAITFQPAGHVMGTTYVDLVVRRWLVHGAYFLVRCGLWRVHQHEATGN